MSRIDRTFNFLKVMAALLLVRLALFCPPAVCAAQPLLNGQRVVFTGIPGETAGDISAIEQVGDWLVVASDEVVDKDGDERNLLHLMAATGDGGFAIKTSVAVFAGAETDIEGLARDGDVLFVLGSHSSKRQRIKKSDSRKTNRKKFRDKEIKDEEDRDQLYRVEIDDDGNVVSAEMISLNDIFRSHRVLKTFRKLPSKENGIDIEGIAVSGNRLYLGFRGPVFRGNYVPILPLKFESLGEPDDFRDFEVEKLLFVDLKGYGIRSLAKVHSGFLIVAGPMNDAVRPCRLYHWDGKDGILGSDGEGSEPTLLGVIPPPTAVAKPKSAKAEGLVRLNPGDETVYDLIIVYDSAEQGGAMRFRVPIPDELR